MMESRFKYENLHVFFFLIKSTLSSPVGDYVIFIHSKSNEFQLKQMCSIGELDLH